jgi:putative membrane protein
MNLKKYINQSKSNGKKIWLHKLPKNKTLFDVIDNLRKQYNNLRYTFVINQNIRITGITIDREIDFSNCIFKKDVDFSGCTFNKKISFSYIKNNQEKIIANASIFEKGVNFSKVIFKESVNFSGTKFSTKIEIDDNSKIIVNFGGVKFEENTRFHYCEFCNNVTFKNTTFNKLVDFYYAKFFKPQQFHLTDFFDRAIFSNTIFHQEIQFIYCRTNSNSYIGFESAEFKRGLDISRSNFNCNLNFWNITIEKKGEEYIFKNIDDIKYKNDFKAHDEAPSVYKQLRETYRIIKDNFYKQNNKIEGGKFYKRELEIYEISIGKDKDRENGSLSLFTKTSEIYRNITNIIMCLISTFFLLIILLSPIFPFEIIDSNVITILNKNPLILNLLLLIHTLFAYFYYGSDKIILIANKISNDFGTNWVKGVLFTICITILTYITLSFSMLGLEVFSIILIIYMSIVALFISIDSIAKKKIYFIGTILSIIVLVFYTYSIGKYFNFRISIKNVNNFIGDFINIHTFISWKDLKINHKEVTGISLLILFIGRIFIGYGYYQTIQAFRKFGKS